MKWSRSILFMYFLLFLFLSCSFIRQQIRPWFPVRLKRLKDSPSGWRCTSARMRPASLGHSMLPGCRLMKKSNQWSEEWWRNKSSRWTRCRNQADATAGTETCKRGKVHVLNNQNNSFFKWCHKNDLIATLFHVIYLRKYFTCYHQAPTVVKRIDSNSSYFI